MHATGSNRLVRWLMIAALPVMPALAAAPRVLSVVPSEGPLAVIAVDHLERSDARLRAVLAGAGVPPYAALGAMLTTMGAREGLDLAGSGAVLLMPGDEEHPEVARFIIVLRAGEPDAFLKSVGARDEDGIQRFDYAGTPCFARPLTPAYLAISESRTALASLSADPKLTASSDLEAFGPLGARLADGADLLVLTDAERAASLAAMMAALAMNQGGEGVDLNIGGPGAPAEDPLRHVTILESSFPGRLAALIRSESTSVLLAATFDPGAIKIDAASTFVADGVLHRAAQSPKEAGVPAASPLASVPEAPYLLALGVDAAHPGARVLADELGLPSRLTKVGAEAERLALDSIPSMESLALIVYEPASIMFGALARSAVIWRAPAPEEAAKSFRSWIESLNGRPVGSATIVSSYQSSPPIDQWSITPPAGAFPMLPMLLGPTPDVQGTLALRNGHATLTWTREPALLELLARENAPTLDRAEAVARVSAMLPAPRLIEAYADGSSAVRQFAPMLVGKEALRALPDHPAPLGAAVTVEAGVGRLTIVVPQDVLKMLAILNSSDEEGDAQPDRPRERRRPPPRRSKP